MKQLILVALFVSVSADAAAAKTIRNACLKSERGRGKVQLCSCIQQVADRSLSQRDQKKAAVLFNDPERAQRIRTSDSKSDEKFWDRYQVFGTAAEALCRRQQ